MATAPPPGDQRLPANLDLTPTENFNEQPQDLVLWLFNNLELIQKCLNATFHDVGAAIWTIADDSASNNRHFVHISRTGNVTIYLPSNPNDGELFFIKDAAGDGGSFTKSIRVTAASGTIDGSALVTINVNYGWAVIYGYQGNYFQIG